MLDSLSLSLSLSSECQDDCQEDHLATETLALLVLSHIMFFHSARFSRDTFSLFPSPVSSLQSTLASLYNQRLFQVIFTGPMREAYLCCLNYHPLLPLPPSFFFKHYCLSLCLPIRLGCPFILSLVCLLISSTRRSSLHLHLSRDA